MKEDRIVSIEIKEIEPTPQNVKLSTLKLYLSLEIEELIKEKQGKELGNDVPMTISQQDLNNLYFRYINRIERHKGYYFPNSPEDKE
jgi:hypothetical protein